MPGSFWGLTFRDSSNELGKTDFNIGDITALSIAGALTDMGAARTALENITLGTVAQSRFGDADTLSNARPTDPLCQRGVKWTVSWEDTVTHSKGTNYIPTADLSLLPLVGGVRSEDLDLTAGAGLAAKTALDTLAKSPAGNPISVLRIYYSD